MKSIFATRSSVISVAIATLALIAMTAPFFAYADTLNRQLQVGMSGSDVSALQTFLAADVTLYPQGLVTGYFGFLTKSAVANFQSRNGLPAVGRVGPATLPVINAQMANGVGDVNAAILYNMNVSFGTNTAAVSFTSNEAVRATVYYSSSMLNVSESTNNVTVVGASAASTDNTLRSAQNIAISGLQSNTTYYFMVYTTDASGNVTVSVPSSFRTNN